MATVIIPTPLRKFTNNTARLAVSAGTIQDTVNELTLNFPDLKKHLLDESGNIRSYVNIFVGNDDIRNLQQEKTAVKEDAVISIVPAIAGAAPDPLFTKEELARYDRHIIIPAFGIAAHPKLKTPKLFVIVPPRLATPLLLYLAAA